MNFPIRFRRLKRQTCTNLVVMAVRTFHFILKALQTLGQLGHFGQFGAQLLLQFGQVALQTVVVLG